MADKKISELAAVTAGALVGTEVIPVVQSGTTKKATVNDVIASGLPVKSSALSVGEGTNKTMGVATLITGAKVVATNKVTANSRVYLTVQSLGTVTAPKAVAVTARTPATSFTITSADASDTSVVAWMIVEPF